MFLCKECYSACKQVFKKCQKQSKCVGIFCWVIIWTKRTAIPWFYPKAAQVNDELKTIYKNQITSGYHWWERDLRLINKTLEKNVSVVLEKNKDNTAFSPTANVNYISINVSLFSVLSIFFFFWYLLQNTCILCFAKSNTQNKFIIHVYIVYNVCFMLQLLNPVDVLFKSVT